MGKKLDAIGWALFLIWIGVAFLMKVSFGVGLVGVGFITLAVQAARDGRDMFRRSESSRVSSTRSRNGVIV